MSDHATTTANAVLVAGGHGRRAGGPKALKIRDGVAMWRWQVAALRAAGCGHIAAVLHPSAVPPTSPEPAVPPEALESANADSVTLTADVVVVPADPDAEMLASLQVGLAAVATEAQPTFLLPVDCPCPPERVFATLLRRAATLTLRGHRWQVIRPWVQTPTGPRRGHPVLLSPALVQAVRDADPTTGRLDRLIQALDAEVRVDVEVDDPSICANFNRDGLSR